MDIDFKHLSLAVTGVDIESSITPSDLACAVHLDEKLIDILTPISPDLTPESWLELPIGSSNQYLTIILKQISLEIELGRTQVPAHLLKVFQTDEEFCRLTLPLSTSDQDCEENWMEFLKISDVRPPRIHIMFKLQEIAHIQPSDNIEIPPPNLNPLAHAVDFMMSFSPKYVQNERNEEDEEMKTKVMQLERENRKLEMELMLEKQRSHDVETMRLELNNSELARLNALQKLSQIKHKFEEDISILVIHNKQLREMFDMVGTDNKQQVHSLTHHLQTEKLKRQSVINQHNHLAELYQEALDSMKERENDQLKKINDLTQHRSSLYHEIDALKSYSTDLLKDLNYLKEELKLLKNREIKTPESDLRSKVRELEETLQFTFRKVTQQEEIYQETLKNLKEMQRSNLNLRNKLNQYESQSPEKEHLKDSEMYWEDVDRRVLEYIDKFKVKCAVMRTDYGIYIFGEKEVKIKERNRCLIVYDKNVEFTLEQFMSLIASEITPFKIPLRRNSISIESSKSKESIDTITTKESDELLIHHFTEAQLHKETEKRKVVVIEDLEQSLSGEESVSLPSSRRESKRVPIKPYVSKRSPPHKKEIKIMKSSSKGCKSGKEFSPVLRNVKK